MLKSFKMGSTIARYFFFRNRTTGNPSETELINLVSMSAAIALACDEEEEDNELVELA